MFHSSITLAEKARALVAAGEQFDLLFCGGMVNLAEFRTFAPEAVSSLPSVLYVHENQMAYPLQPGQKQDYRFGLIQLASGLAASRVWFNSGHNRATMLDGLATWLKTLPPAGMEEKLDVLRGRSEIVSPGVVLPEAVDRTGRDGPLHILWAHRWEYDKQPAVLLAALRELRQRGVAFRLSVIGEQFSASPPEFETIRDEFADEIVRWGYQPTRAEYLAALAEADVAISTASHEFFGIGVLPTQRGEKRAQDQRRLDVTRHVTREREVEVPRRIFARRRGLLVQLNSPGEIVLPKGGVCLVVFDLCRIGSLLERFVIF